MDDGNGNSNGNGNGRSWERNASFLSDTRRTLDAIDAEYNSLGRLGIGGFGGSVFLASKKKSGRKVALKVMPMDTSDDDDYERFTRELESVVEVRTYVHTYVRI